MNKAWRERLLRYCIGGIELLVLYTLLSFISYRASGGTLTVIGILFIYVFSFIFNRLIFNYKIRASVNYIFNIVLWLIVTHLVIKLLILPDISIIDTDFLLAVYKAIMDYASGFRQELIVFIVSVPLWILGYRLGRMRIGFGISLAEFQSGLVLILFTFYLNSQIGATSLSSILIPLIYVALAIFALTISHAEQASSWLSSRHAIYWFGLLIISIVVILVVGFLAGNFTSHDFLDLLFTPIRWAWWLFSRFMIFLAEHTPMEKVINPLDWDAQGGSNPEAPEDVFRMFQLPLWIRDTMRFILFIAWFSFIILALWRMASFFILWLKSHFVGRTQAEVESLHGAFKDDILSLLYRIWGWIVNLFRGDHGKRVVPELQSVRQIYREVLFWGAVKGVRRQSDVTPYEYLTALSEAVPLAADDLRLITDRYVDARYGSITPQKDEVDKLKATWQRMKRNGYSQK